ncbi:LuxR family transcriptional regulator [Bradyrhizobium sp. Tv2a-2]|uniref:LuxR family transcriptional regulator n=1 Tax=Bradyrhizobium sp. Tv2a-2 TaxID=113395 RepID=UPI0004639234|nr:LuxR family transcriptional regulator [Bradyrhizobium sp. Tv2a-2]
MNFHALQDFIDQLTESTNEDALQKSMANIADAMNLACFAYLCLPQQPGESPKLISTYPPSWIAYYLQNQYEHVDPVISQAIRHNQPFRWGLGLGPRLRSEPQRELFEEAARFGIRYGFTIPIHDSRGAISAVTFATDKRRVDFERSIQEHANVLRVLAILFHARARLTLSSDRLIDGVLLSPRQLECLEWSSRGKSAWEIGTILGISQRTAAFHLDNARAKLGVRTLRQAVVRLVESKARR